MRFGCCGSMISPCTDPVGAEIRHVYFAEVQSRSFPVVDNEHYGKFFDRLRSLRYDGRCSIEAYTQNLAPTASGRWKS